MTDAEEAIDALYAERASVVMALARAAYALGYRVGWWLDADIDDPHLWPVLFLDLPTGQVSWHIADGDTKTFPIYARTWDGHTTDEKYKRLAKWRPKVPLLRGTCIYADCGNGGEQADSFFGATCPICRERSGR